MPFNKPKLILDLKGWMDAGAANGFPAPLSGVSPLISIISTYAIGGTDLFGNTVTSFSGSALTAQLMLLAVPGDPLTGAIKFATGFNIDWTSATLSSLSGPPNMLAPVSNIISVPPLASSTQSLFLSAFSGTYPESLLAATALANAIEGTCKQATFTFTYLQNIPPAFPPAAISGNLS